MNLKKKLENKDLSIGSWITLGHSGVAEIMSNAGFDWLAIDLEHSSISIKEAEELIRIIDLSNVTPLVRLTSNNPDLIKRVMDAGAKGIIVPMVNSIEDARQAIDSAYYPPKGKRSFGLARAQGYGSKFEEYLHKSSEDTVIVVQIEHIDALDEIEKILSLKEIDAYMIGPYDLSGSIGIPGRFENTDYLETIEQIDSIARKIGKPGGIHIVEPDIELLKKAKEKYSFIAYSVDFRMIDTCCRDALISDS